MIDEKKLVEEIKRHKVITTFEDDNPIDCGFNAGLDRAIELVSSQPKVDEWIPVEERMPEEHDSVFAKYKGTIKWLPGMFEKCSDEVEVTFKLTNDAAEEERIVRTSHTNDGKWSIEKELGFFNEKVVAWRTLREPY